MAFPIFTCNTLSEHSEHITHGFFGRQGGVSSGVYESLNCGFGSNDTPENVKQNRTIVMQQLGIPNHQLCSLYQIHSNHVVQVNEKWDMSASIQADAMVSNTPGYALGILTADCVPVLFYDPATKVIGAAHAGWRGAFDGVLEQTIAAMQTLGANIDTIIATLGCCIGKDSYEVDQSFRENFLQASPENETYFTPGIRDGHYFFDIAGYEMARLRKAGLKHVQSVNQDTLANESLFFSYRRNTLQGIKDYGRQISVIGLI